MNITKYLKSENLQNFFLLLFYQLSFVIYKDSFKIMVVITFIFFIIFLIKKTDLFLASSMLFISSIAFYFPLNRHEVLLAPPENYVFEPFRFGLMGIYGLNISDIITLVLLFSLFLKKRKTVLSKKIVALLSLLIAYLLIGIYSAMFNSLFPEYSLITHVQTMKMIFAILVSYILVCDKSSEIFFKTAVVSVFIFHSLFGISNIFTPKQVFQSLLTPEEDLVFSRIDGVIGHPVVHMVILFIVFIIVTYYLLRKDSFNLLFFLSTLALFLFNLIFSQSRSAWIIFIVSLFFHRKILMRYFNKIEIFDKKNVLHVSSLGIVLSCFGFIVFDRIIKSINFFNISGGGLDLRTQMITQGIALFQFAPWFGHGVNTTVVAFFNYIPESYVRFYPLPVHLTPLLFILETGLVGLTSFSLFFLIYSLYFIRARLIVPSRLKNLMYTFFSLLIVHYLFHPIDGYRRDLYFIGLFVGWSVALGERYVSKKI